MTDKETKKIETEQQMVAATLQTPGWKIIEAVKERHVNDMYDMRNLKEEVKDPVKFTAAAQSRDGAAQYIEAMWNEIKGLAEQSAFDNQKGETDAPDVYESR